MSTTAPVPGVPGIPLFYLKPHAIRRVIVRSHMCQEGFARTLGLSRSHWSQLLNGRRPLSTRVRRGLLECPLLRGLSEQDLWKEVEAEAPTTNCSPITSPV